jgi:arylsulfatase A-like enzyme
MIRTALAVLLLVGLVPWTSAAPPNVVMIVADDQGWGDYSFMGHPTVRTPNIDKLASESLISRRGYVPSSLCRASLATMITGQYPHQHQVTSNDPPLPKGKTGAAANKDPAYLTARQEMIAYIEKAVTLPWLLSEAGYVSMQAGKWWEGNACRCGGFTEGMTHGDPAKGGRHGDDGLKVGREGLKPVLDFIDGAAAKKKPFYVWYAPMMPHSPHNPPERLLGKYKDKTPSIHVARYWAMIEWFDETVGELLGHLDRKGVAGETLVVYLCDNGWLQDPDSPNYAPRSKRSPYDGGVRTPILVRWPSKVKPRTAEELASSIDLAPTILTAAGLKPTAAMPGVNLLDTDAVKARKAVFGEIFEHNAVDIHQPAANLQYRWVIEGDWKLIVPAARMADGRVELFDLKRDSEEKVNRAEGERETVTRLQALLDTWWAGKE